MPSGGATRNAQIPVGPGYQVQLAGSGEGALRAIEALDRQGFLPRVTITVPGPSPLATVTTTPPAPWIVVAAGPPVADCRLPLGWAPRLGSSWA